MWQKTAISIILGVCGAGSLIFAFLFHISNRGAALIRDGFPLDSWYKIWGLAVLGILLILLAIGIWPEKKEIKLPTRNNYYNNCW